MRASTLLFAGVLEDFYRVEGEGAGSPGAGAGEEAAAPPAIIGEFQIEMFELHHNTALGAEQGKSFDRRRSTVYVGLTKFSEFGQSRQMSGKVPQILTPC